MLHMWWSSLFSSSPGVQLQILPLSWIAVESSSSCSIQTISQAVELICYLKVGSFNASWPHYCKIKYSWFGPAHGSWQSYLIKRCIHQNMRNLNQNNSAKLHSCWDLQNLTNDKIPYFMIIIFILNILHLKYSLMVSVFTKGNIQVHV